MIALTPKTQKTVSTPYSRESWDKMISACKDKEIVGFFSRFRFIGKGVDGRYHFKEMDYDKRNYNDELRQKATNIMQEYLTPSPQGVDYYDSSGYFFAEPPPVRGSSFFDEMIERIKKQEYLPTPYSHESWNKMISACKDKNVLDLFSRLRFIGEAPANYYHFHETDVDAHNYHIDWQHEAADMMQQYLCPSLKEVNYYDNACIGLKEYDPESWGIYPVRIG